MSAIEMARRVCAEHDHNKAYQYLEGRRDDYPTMMIALAAIRETTEAAANMIEEDGMTTNYAGVPVMHGDNQRLAVALRNGGHLKAPRS